MVLILSKQTRNEYETARLVESFALKNINARVCHPEDFDIVVGHDNIKDSIKYKGESFALPKLVLCRLGAGITEFHLTVLRQFEKIGILTINNSETINTVKNKLITGQILAVNNIPIPKTMMVHYPIDDSLIAVSYTHLTLPTKA